MTKVDISNSPSAAARKNGNPYIVVDDYLYGRAQDRTGKGPAEQGVIAGVNYFDTSHPVSWPNQDQPLNGEAMYNLAGGAPGVWREETQSASGPLSWDATQKAVGFAAVKRGPTGFRTPPGIVEAFAGNAPYLLWVVAKLPELADWPTAKGSLNGIVGDSTTPGGTTLFAAISMNRNNDMLNGGAGSRQLGFRRGVNGATVQNATINDTTTDGLAALTAMAGKWCLLSVWKRQLTGGSIMTGHYAATIADLMAPISPAEVAATANANSLTGRQLTWGLDGTSNIANTYSHLAGAGDLEALAVDADPISILNAHRLRLRDIGRWT